MSDKKVKYNNANDDAYCAFEYGVDDDVILKTPIGKKEFEKEIEDIPNEEQEIEDFSNVINKKFIIKALLISIVVGGCAVLLLGAGAGVVCFCLTLISYFMFSK